MHKASSHFKYKDIFLYSVLQAHLPIKCLLAENGHKQRGECKQPPHHDQPCEPGRAARRAFMAQRARSRVLTATLLRVTEVCRQLVPSHVKPEDIRWNVAQWTQMFLKQSEKLCLQRRKVVQWLQLSQKYFKIFLFLLFFPVGATFPSASSFMTHSGLHVSGEKLPDSKTRAVTELKKRVSSQKGKCSKEK